MTSSTPHIPVLNALLNATSASSVPEEIVINDDRFIDIDASSLACSCEEGILKWKYIETKADAHYWKSQHARSVIKIRQLNEERKQQRIVFDERENKLNEKIVELEAKVRLREAQLFGKKSERNSQSEKSEIEEKAPKKRGHQHGQKGHGRQANQDLPIKEEFIDLPEAKRCCKKCQLPYEEFPGTEDSEIIEIDVRAYKRQIKRKRYRSCCLCDTPKIITAPPAARLIPKGKIGVSMWVQILLDKFEYYRPTHRFLNSLKNLGMNLPAGTVTSGLKKQLPLFTPIYQAIIEFNQKEKLWNADETRWEVFADLAGKIGHRWYLWVFAGMKSVVFYLDPTRSKAVPKKHLGNSSGKLIVDRYKAYFVLLKNGITLAFCWAHVRRDFITHAKKYPHEETWALSWVEDIRELYYINDQRIAAWKIEDINVFEKMQIQLQDAIDKIYEKSSFQQKDVQVSKEAKKVLESLDNHQEGLTVFVKHPEVSMDNNRGERILRGPVIGRKGFYGSGSIWSGLLAAMLFSIFQTLKLWQINPNTWLTLFLQACANNQGQIPKNWKRFLPWNMNKKQLSLFRKPIICDTS
jgi:transposase